MNKVRPLFHKLGLYRTNKRAREQYTDIPSGPINIDRLLASLPAFKSMSEASDHYRPKKILITNLLDPKTASNPLYALKCLMWLRQLMTAENEDERFELYQYRDGAYVKLSLIEMTKCFEFKHSDINDEDAQEQFIQETGSKFDDIAFFNDALFQQLSHDSEEQPNILWEIDLTEAPEPQNNDPKEIYALLSRLTTFIINSTEQRKDPTMMPKIDRIFSSQHKPNHIATKTLLLSGNFDDITAQDNISNLESLAVDDYVPSKDMQLKLQLILINAPHLKDLRILFDLPRLGISDLLTVPLPALESLTLAKLKLDANTIPLLLAQIPNLKQIEVKDLDFQFTYYPQKAQIDFQLANPDSINDDAINTLRLLFNITGIQTFNHNLQRHLSLLLLLTHGNVTKQEKVWRLLLNGDVNLRELNLFSPDFFFSILQKNRLDLPFLEKINFGNHELTLEQLELLGKYYAKRYDIDSSRRLIRIIHKKMPLNLKGHKLSSGTIYLIYKNLDLYTSITYDEGQLPDKVKEAVDRLNRGSAPISTLPSLTLKISVGDTADKPFNRHEMPMFNETAQAPHREVVAHQHQPLSLPPQQLNVDANTQRTNQTFNLPRHFYSIGNNNHPEPNHYRLSSYHRVRIIDAPSSINNAFELQYGEDLRPASIQHPTFHREDVYEHGQSLPTATQAHTYYAKVTLNLTAEWQPLPSLAIGESITDMHVDGNINVEITYRQADNLYYIREHTHAHAQKVVIDYLVQTPLKQAMAPGSALQQFINHFQSFSEGELKQLPAFPTGKDYLIALATQQKGACRHRALVFKALLDNPDYRKTIPALAELNLEGIQARIINNDCHTFVEIQENGQWFSCDLGGYHATLNINETNNPLNQPPKPSKREALIITTADDLSKVLERPEVKTCERIDFQNRAPTTADIIRILNHAPQLQQLEFDYSKLNDEITYVAPHNEHESSSESLTERNYFQKPAIPDIPNKLRYIQETFTSDKPKRLIECTPQQLDGLSEALQDYCQTKIQRPYFVINDTAMLVLNHPYIALQHDDTGVIKKGHHGALYESLQSHDDNAPILIVNFAHFSASERAQFNSLLDSKPAIDGIPLPQGTKVIGLINTATYKDASLYSRFVKAVDICPIPTTDLVLTPVFQTESQQASQADSLTIECYGMSHWKSMLLGHFGLRESGLQYLPSELIQRLRNKLPVSSLIINNPPDDPEFEAFFRTANIRGYIEYEDQKIDWPKPALYLTHQLTFKTDAISQVSQKPPINQANILNTSTLYHFLNRYEFNEINGKSRFIEIDGLLAEHAQQHPHAPMIVYVSDELNEKQWVMLLDACKQKNVLLNIHLAPGVRLPEPLSEHAQIESSPGIEIPTFSSENRPDTDHCIASSDPDLTLEQYKSIQHPVIIDVSEINSADLCDKITGGVDQEKLQLAFSKQTGALLQALNQNKTVILHGTFAPELRHALQGVLYERQKIPQTKGKLILITNSNDATHFSGFTKTQQHQVTSKEKITQLIRYRRELKTTKPLQLKNLDATRPFITLKSEVRHQLSTLSTSQWAGLSMPLPDSRVSMKIDLQTPSDQPNAINQARLDAVASVLSHSPFIFLAGKSGIGKTTFVEQVWKNANRHLHVGESALRQWANDASPGLKALFLDEANMTDKQWSAFEDMFLNNPPGLMIGNEFVPLTTQHKVIFAGNPVDYSADRTLPRLFKRHGNSVVFEPLPPAYLFHELLRPLFAHDDANAETICAIILKLNLSLNNLDSKNVLLTPRELIMMVQLTINYCKRYPSVSPEKAARHYAYQLARPFVPVAHVATFDAQFKPQEALENTPFALPKDSEITLTPSNQPIAAMLDDLLHLRQSCINGDMGNQPPGLGGMLIEGAPGLGKSELAVACFIAHGIHERKINNPHPPTNQAYFYRLPAGAEPEVKQTILERAFQEGAIVIYDEMNTAASHEALLNRLLMGKGPDGKAARQPGFMLIGTQNPTNMPGREATSQPIMHRMHFRVLQAYNRDEMQDILRHMGLPERRCQLIVEDYLTKSITDKSLCFRHVVNEAEYDLHALLGKAPKDMSHHALLALAQSPLSSAEVLEAVYRHARCNNDIKLALAKHPHVDSSILEMLIKDTDNPYHQDFIHIAFTAPRINASIFNLLWEEKERRFDLIRRPYCTNQHLKALIEVTSDATQLTTLAQLSIADESCLINIANKCKEPKLVSILTHHPNSTNAVLNACIDSSTATETLMQFIWFSGCAQDTLQAILEHGILDENICRSILMHPACRTELIDLMLKKTDDPLVLAQVIAHPQCTFQHLHEINQKRSIEENPALIAVLKKKIIPFLLEMPQDKAFSETEEFKIESLIHRCLEDDENTLTELSEKTKNPTIEKQLFLETKDLKLALALFTRLKPSEKPQSEILMYQLTSKYNQIDDKTFLSQASSNEITNILNHIYDISPPKIQQKKSFFSISTCSDYPVIAIKIALEVLKTHYTKIDGKHLNHLSKLIEDIQKLPDHEAIIKTINELTYSGKIGRSLGTGRLRKSLIYLVNTIETGEHIDIEQMCSPMTEKKPLVQFK